MSRTGLTGSRIRARRIDLEMRQARLAELCGISASYLNLIEHNRRRIGGKLLNDIASALQTNPSALAEGADEALINALHSAAISEDAAQPETGRIEEFAGRFPGWAQLVALQAEQIRGLEQSVEALNDRLAHDPQLAASLHDILSSVTGIRSASAILVSDEAIEPAWEARFHRNIHEDSRRLADAAEGLVSYLEADHDDDRQPVSHLEEFEAWLSDIGYHFPDVESGADPEDVLENTADGLSPPVKEQAGRHLRLYRQDAEAIPLSHIADALEEFGLDPVALSGAITTPLSTLMRRLAALPDDMLGEDLGLAICDPSGSLTFQRPIAGFALPRYGAACPMLPLFAALSRPMHPIAAIVEQAGRTPQKFRTYSVAEASAPARFGAQQLFASYMLTLPVEPGVVDASDPIRSGLTCRVCPRTNCAARREPSMLSSES